MSAPESDTNMTLEERERQHENTRHRHVNLITAAFIIIGVSAPIIHIIAYVMAATNLAAASLACYAFYQRYINGHTPHTSAELARYSQYIVRATAVMLLSNTACLLSYTLARLLP